ncbi:MAG: hypothetical protein ISS57_11795 [Anaerolineales bacterium]|nr:hypothetical protein [Deltaproteobacteria bacterium]MBL7163282.1 hypothetical protein [Anaerolineales bacterium]
MSHKERYQIVPQMETYNTKFPKVITPYLTLFHQANYRSEIINTDSAGFRFSYREEVRIDNQSWWSQKDRGIVLGGSFAFSEGATNDHNTLVSNLNSITGSSFINLGIKGGNSIQELITAIPFLADTEKAIVCSGMNNLVVSLQSTGRNELFGPLFSEGLVDKLTNYSINTLVRRASFDEVGTVILIKMLLTRIGKVLFGQRREKKKRRTAKGQDKYEALRKAVEWTQRDLRIIDRSLPTSVKVTFIMQPFASASSKELTPEEQRLFNITDNLAGSHWEVLKNDLVELWPSYVHELETMCSELGIAFMDLSEKEFDGWVYVDRVHMTDKGYLQAAQFIAEEL